MSDDEYVHRPWFETAQGRAQFAVAKRMLRIMVYVSGSQDAGLRGWDRITRRQGPERRCPCCRQVLEHQHTHVLTDAEYRIVDATLTRAYEEFVLAETDPSLRHMANAYHIVERQVALLEYGLIPGLAASVYNFLALVPRLNGGSVPHRDVQTY